MVTPITKIPHNRCMLKYGLHVTVKGDADITKRSHGGIDDYSPTEANRHTKVMLHIK